MEIFLHQDLSTNWTNIWSIADRGSGGLGRPLLVACSNAPLACRQTVEKSTQAGRMSRLQY